MSQTQETPAPQDDETASDATDDQNDILKQAWQEAAESEPGMVDAISEMATAHPTNDQRIPEYEARIAELQDQVLRATAETENVRRRAQRDVEESGKFAISGFARDLTAVCDNLNRAAESIPEEARQENDMLKNLYEGVDMTLRELLGVFERYNIQRIHPMGDMFDHNLHQAVVQIEDDNHPAGTILQVMQAGYTLNGRLLRPAMVGVSKPTSQPSEPAPQVDTEA